jgi:hypothetical protein
MILTTHAIAGAAVACAVPNYPVAGFALGFASHFVLDAIPHWDYKLTSYSEDQNNPMNNDMTLDKKFIFDFAKICLDVFVGFACVFALSGFLNPIYTLPLFAGAVGGVLPDALQFVYFKWRHEPLVALQKFHLRVHFDKHSKN